MNLRAFLQDEISFWEKRTNTVNWSERFGAMHRLAELRRVVACLDSGLFEAEECEPSRDWKIHDATRYGMELCDADPIRLSEEEIKAIIRGPK